MISKNSAAAFICLMTGLCAWTLSRAAEAASCDATTGASCKVVGVKTTLAGATLSWTEGRHNGSRTFCYGIGTPGKCSGVSSRASGVKNQVVTGLAPNTKYAYKFYGTWGGRTKSVVTGSFVTDNSACGTSVITVVEVNGVVLTTDGDSLENVIATISKQNGGQIMGKDTSDASGGYRFQVDPGTYSVSLSYPPFTAPAPFTATVITSKPLDLPDQTMKDAFQIGGTVVSEGAGDSLMGVTVTVLKKSDNSTAGTRMTAADGHFSIGLKPGDYLVNAAYLGKNLPSPIAITVTKSMRMSNIAMPVTTGILRRPGPEAFGAGSKGGSRAVDAKGTFRNGIYQGAVRWFETER